MNTLPDNIKEIRFSDGAGMIYSALIAKSDQDNFMMAMQVVFSIRMDIELVWNLQLITDLLPLLLPKLLKCNS